LNFIQKPIDIDLLKIKIGSLLRKDKLKGQEAFFELVSWVKGIFSIFHGQTTDQINVNMDTRNLLLEASRALDEKRHLAEMK
jgi:uncharacterized protein DUF4388